VVLSHVTRVQIPQGALILLSSLGNYNMVLNKIKSGLSSIREERNYRTDLLMLSDDIKLYIKLGNYKRAQIRAQELVNKLKI
tara:strand:- start:179 stop:424 length:246 start_codon:yes stop_codon:yes gene_type:complete